jgi:hypothetical protein
VREPRLAAILGGLRGHRIGRHVRRVGYDEVVAPVGKFRVEIRLQQRYALAEAVVVDVASRDRERRSREVGGVDAGSRKARREQNGEAARAGAEIER